MKYQLIIFDWDGTLADSVGRIIDSMQRAAIECNLPAVPDDAIRNIIGLGLPEAIRTVWPKVTSEQMKPMREAYARYFVADSAVEMKFFPGVKPMLDRLKVDRMLAVATGKSRKGLNRIIATLNLESFFDITRCADETHSKPNPLMLNEILETLGISVGAALMVGDTSYDLEMANAIGMDSVAMSYGAHDEDVLLACSPRTICHSIAELEHWIELNG